jgi:hypothetical protein
MDALDTHANGNVRRFNFQKSLNIQRIIRPRKIND